MRSVLLLGRRLAVCVLVRAGMLPRLLVSDVHTSSCCVASCNVLTLSFVFPENVTLETIVESLKEGRYKKVLVVAGAGVSCSAGIPDVSML